MTNERDSASEFLVVRVERIPPPVFSKNEPRQTWPQFVGRLRPVDEKTFPSQTPLRDLLASLKLKPSLYWYPGSGDDLTPLHFDALNHGACQRLLRLDDTKSIEEPVILLMNDHCRGPSLDFPAIDKVWTGYDQDYTSLRSRRDHAQWRVNRQSRYQVRIETPGPHEKFSLQTGFASEEPLPITIFKAIVTLTPIDELEGPALQAVYIVLFANSPSHLVFREIVLKHGLHVETVALIKQGGFSNQLHYEQYTNLPQWLIENANLIDGAPESFIIDAQGVSSSTFEPRSKALKNYERVGVALQWGWYPCSIFAKVSPKSG